MKKSLLELATLFDEPILPLILNSIISVSLKRLRVIIELPKPIPKSSMLECDKSKSKPKENLSIGVKMTDKSSPKLSLKFFLKVMLGYLKFFNSVIYLKVLSLFSSLYMSPSEKSITSVKTLAL